MISWYVKVFKLCRWYANTKRLRTAAMEYKNIYEIFFNILNYYTYTKNGQLYYYTINII